jgi:predicted SAM-dependent methyltransferase
MSSLRSAIRNGIPFSTELYEYQDNRRRLSRSRKQLRSLRESGREISLDLGGGDRKGTGGWLTVDITHNCDLYWDLRLGIPFADNSVSRIYSSHMFEHLTYSEAQGLLDECMRALKPGGSFSIVVPNAGMYIEGYMGQRELPAEYFGWEPAFNRTTRIDALNYVAYMAGEHKYMFDQENLLHILTAKGFVNVSARAFDPETDMQERDFESIYAIGYKRA